MSLSDFGDPQYWHWFSLALIFLILEMLLPGVVFLWLAIAGGITGLFVLTMDPGTVPQLTVFAVTAVVSAVVGRNLYKRNEAPTDQPNLNRRGEHHIGRSYILVEPIVNGTGSISIGDSVWRVEGIDDAPAGATVKVVGIEGASLIVERA